jgi:hypothetical protein
MVYIDDMKPTGGEVHYNNYDMKGDPSKVTQK